MSKSMAISCVLAVVMVMVVVPAHAQTECNTSLVQAVAANPNLAELAKFIEQSNLDDKLDTTDHNVTLLAPNNAAFNGTGGLYAFLAQRNLTLQQLTGQADDSDNRAGSILLYHIITVPALVAQLTNGQRVPTELEGYNLGVSKTNPTPTTVSLTFIGNATNATVLNADIRVCNSVVHVVNRVLLPSSNITAIPKYDDDTPTPGVGGASGLAIGTWAFALSGALAAALMM